LSEDLKLLKDYSLYYNISRLIKRVDKNQING
jgi:hypothetical protein